MARRRDAAGRLVTSQVLRFGYTVVRKAEVKKMRQNYKAPVPDEDVKPIVDYLTRIKGDGH